MVFKFGKKFTDKDLDSFIHKIYINNKSNPRDTYFFDLSEVEFIGNQELLVFSALLKSFKESGINFQVEFFKRGIPRKDIPERVNKQIVQIWEVWQIWRIVNPEEYDTYFGISALSVRRLKDELNYNPKLSELYNRHGVTPFISLSYINNYNEGDIQKIISPIYRLNSVIENLLKANKCSHPFTSNSLSTIITEELYLNFLDHSENACLIGLKPMSFMSISFQAKLDESKYSSQEIQITKKLNFESEFVNETFSFFYDNQKKEYKNQSYIQFSFLDFGRGIVQTLLEQYKKQNGINDEQIIESEVLKYAFKHDSSRHPISNNIDKERSIPRGLFDALTIVRRYKGMLIARSNYGKIVFDFSQDNEIEKAYKDFANSHFYFPGTLISIYLPATEDVKQIDTSTIKVETRFAEKAQREINHLSINSVISSVDRGKSTVYNEVLQKLKAEIVRSTPALTIISFKESRFIEKRLIKKILYFLISDYEINQNNSVLILDLQLFDLIDEIENEILSLDKAIKNYKIHPLPIINYNEYEDEIKLEWLGIYDKEDKTRLKDLLYENYSIAKSDFNEPNNVIGNTNQFDKYGNLISSIPVEDELKSFFLKNKEVIEKEEALRVINKYNCIKPAPESSIYLCNGNYYQKEYIQLSNLLNDKNDCTLIANLLYSKTKAKVKDLDNYKLIGISSASQKVINALYVQGVITIDDFTILDIVQSTERDIDVEKIAKDSKYILICDVLSTGYITMKLNDRLKSIGSSIEFVSVIVSVLDNCFNPTKALVNTFQDKIISLLDYPIKKYSRSDLKGELLSNEIIRVNPYTDIPITLSINETNFNETIIFSSEVDYLTATNEIRIENNFLEHIKADDIKIGYLKFNNVIHPYFFNTSSILKEINENVLSNIFKKIKSPGLYGENIQVFYPRKSGIESFDFDLLKKVLSNHSIEEIAIERINTPEGWRFPHNIDYLSSKIEDHICFILDDGSCSGDSLIQMIDEISFYQAKEIILLCIIGRVNDHKREFFSRLSEIKVKDGNSIKLSIYFASHWHIPTYFIDENPNTREGNWLKDLLGLQNTPRSIKRIATNILTEISPKPDTEFKDFKYLPKKKVGQISTIPKKELLLIREELGKVIGFRLYKESFRFFDAFVKKYENKKYSKERYKEIELLCATFLYEPYLYSRVHEILPDVVDLIEDFVRVLIFSDQKIYDSLTYDWNKRDILHLFFIVFRDNKLTSELTTDKFKSLIAFTLPRESALSYVLYKLLNYFPLKADQFELKKLDTSIKDLLFRIIEEDANNTKELKRFYNFISTLPSREDFNSQLVTLRDNYIKQIEPEYHDERISFGHNVSYILANLRECITLLKDGKDLDTNKISNIRNYWFEILTFINPILSFSSTFPEFLIPFPYFKLYNKIESSSKSLRQMVGENEDVIFALNEKFADLEKLKLVDKNIINIQSGFEVNSIFHQLVETPKTNLSEFVNELNSNLKSLNKEIEVNLIDINSIDEISIPRYYSSNLIIKELCNNIKNHSSNILTSVIKVSYSLNNEGLFEIEIENQKDENISHKSSGEGLKCLKLLTESNLFGFTYSSKSIDKQYIQHLKFTII